MSVKICVQLLLLLLFLTACSDKLERLQEKAEHSDPEAMFELGGLYERGEGVEKKIYKALWLYLRAARGGNVEAQYKLGLLYRQKPFEDKAASVYWLSEAALAGHTDARYELARFYLKSEGAGRDLKEGATLLKKLAESGHRRAQNDLGSCYYRGSGVEKNYSEAFKWYEKSANQGEATGQFNLAVCYEKGQGTDKNLAEAVKYYKKAAAQGYAPAIFNLGLCYDLGSGVDRDLKKAAALYRKAAEKGYAEAQLALAECLMYGDGVDKNFRAIWRPSTILGSAMRWAMELRRAFQKHLSGIRNPQSRVMFRLS